MTFLADLTYLMFQLISILLILLHADVTAAAYD